MFAFFYHNTNNNNNNNNNVKLPLGDMESHYAVCSCLSLHIVKYEMHKEIIKDRNAEAERMKVECTALEPKRSALKQEYDALKKQWDEMEKTFVQITVYFFFYLGLLVFFQ